MCEVSLSLALDSKTLKWLNSGCKTQKTHICAPLIILIQLLSAAHRKAHLVTSPIHLVFLHYTFRSHLPIAILKNGI